MKHRRQSSDDETEKTVKTCQSLDPNLDQDYEDYNKISFTEDPNEGNNETEDHNGVDDNSDGDDGN